MPGASQLGISGGLPVVALNGGLFVSPGTGIHPDRVIDSHELIFVRRGVLHIAEEGREFAVRAGQSLLLFAGRRHRGTQAYQPGLSFYWVHFSESRAGRREPSLRVPQLATPARPDRLGQLLHGFLGDQKAGRLTPTQASLLVMLMLCEASSRAAGGDESDAAVAAIAGAEAYIDAHFHEPITAGVVAAKLGYNPDYLSRLFRRVHRKNLTQAIAQRRHREACHLLRDTSLSLKEIAHHCGYKDPGYFRRVFAQIENIAPSAYRVQYLRVHVNVR